MYREWSFYDGIWAYDWMAADEATSEWVSSRLEADGPAGWAPLETPVTRETLGHLLEQTRHSLRLTRAEAAERAHLGASTVYAYERGTRAPSREGLLALSRALALPATTTNQLLLALGLEPEPSDLARWMLGERPPGVLKDYRPPTGSTTEEVYAELDSLAWPCFLVNSQCEVERANRAAEALTGLSRMKATPGRSGPHLVQFLLDPSTRSRTLNWPVLARSVLPDSLRMQVPHLSDPKNPGSFQRELSVMRRSDPVALRALLEAWETAPGRGAPLRVAVPIQWLGDGGEVLAFDCFVTRWNAKDLWWAIDWHPANPAAWAAYRLAAGR
jgi:transcriptional regulator with XRE-family HTH domain